MIYPEKLTIWENFPGLKNYLLAMKLSVIFCFLGIFQVSASIYSQNTKLSFAYKDKSVKEILIDIEKNTDFRFFYNENYINLDRKVSMIGTNKPVEQILTELLALSDAKFKVLENNLVVIAPKELMQQKVVTGIVTDSKTGAALAGVNVLVKGTTIGAITDLNGKYSITLPDVKGILVFSYVGYQIREYPVSENSIIDIALDEEMLDLDEIVVVGYGSQKKVNLTGAVSNVNSSVLKDRPLTNLAQGLEGTIANLNIDPISGQPGQAASFNIRGYTGLGIFESPLILVDGVIMDPNLINPSDVESVSVLKDAASSAIYGARAAFGVVLITTKSGKKNQLFKVNYNSNFSFSSPTRYPKIANSWETLLYEQSAFGVSQVSQDYKDELYAHYLDPSKPYATLQGNSWLYYANTDWYKEALLNQAASNKQDINFSGGTDKITYYVSGGMQNQGGLFRYGNDNYKKYNFRSDLHFDLKSWLSFNFKATYTNTDYNAPDNNYLGGGSYWNNIIKMPVTYPVTNPDGQWDTQLSNPIQFLSDGGRDIKLASDSWVVLGTELRPFPGFKIKGDFSVNYNASNEQAYLKELYTTLPNGIVTPTAWTTNPYVTQTNATVNYNALNIWSEYEKTIAVKHYMKFLVGFNQEKNSNRMFSAQKYDPVDANVGEIALSTGQSIANSGASEWAVRGLFFRLNYIFDEKYLLEINGRYDGSSKFPINDRFGFFPSLSLGWRISNESFMKWMKPLVNELKLRASYGSLGNQNVSGNYPYISNLNFYMEDPGSHYLRWSHYLDGAIPMAVDPAGLVSPNLTWVKINALNLGLDFSIFKNRLSLSFDCYQRETKGILGSQEAPAILGTTPPLQNLYNMETRGWEFACTWKDYIMGSLSYNIGFNLSDSKGIVTKYDANPTKYIFDYYNGETMGDIWGWKTDGLFQSNAEATAWENKYKQSLIFGTPPGGWMAGDMKFVDVNKNGVIDIGTETVSNPGDRIIIGNNTPRYRFGFTAGMQWKGFDLTSFFQGVGKRDWQMGSGDNSLVFWGPGGGAWDYNLNYWSPTNTAGYYPRVGGIRVSETTMYLQNAAYIRFKSLVLGYTLPKAIFNKIGVEAFRVYCSGQNLWTYTKLCKGLDPEGISDPTGWGDGEVYPIQKALSVGLNVTF
jgi:TonB-linked SusC/RagA family outer membrane protein